MKIIEKSFIENFSALGALPFFSIIIFTLYLLKQTSFALELLLGILIAHIVTYLIRLVYHKERPRPQKYSSLIEKIDAASFPSLHSVRATVFFVIGVFNIKSLFAIIFFSAYLLVILFSRYYLKKHHLADIIVGAVIGFCIGLAIMLFTPMFY